MMTRTHGMTGIAVWMGGDTLTRMFDLHHPYYLTLAGALITWSAAKAPDIDNPCSKPGQQINMIIPGASEMIEATFGRRGITHWAGTGIANGLVIGFLACLIHPSLWWIGLAVIVGWLTHIAGDCCTYQGAPAYGPFIRKAVRLPYGYRIECGGPAEVKTVYPLALTLALSMTLASVALTVFS